MKNFIIKTLIIAAAVVIASYFLPGVAVKRFTTALMVALVLSVLYYFVKPILVILTLPITIITLGLFLFMVTKTHICINEFIKCVCRLAGPLPNGNFCVNYWYKRFICHGSFHAILGEYSPLATDGHSAGRYGFLLAAGRVLPTLYLFLETL